MSKKTKNTIQPHTEAKLKFYIHYLERYLPILCKTRYVDKINIYDMFCGQSIYDDGKESGAVRAFNKIKEVKKIHRNSSTKITLTLNDFDKSRIEDIKKWCDAQKKTFTICICNEDATDLIGKLIEGISNKQNRTTRNLVFIDPYGYKQIDKLLIEALLKNKRTEVIIFLPINQMTRFKGKTLGDDVEKYFLPLKEFVEQFDINVETINGDIDLIKAIEQSLSFNNQYFSTSYHIKNQQGSYYALFFITPHILGLDKIVEVKWKLDEQQGSGFNHTNQVDMFLETQKIATLEKKLVIYLEERKNNNEIYEWTLKQGFKPKHAIEILTKLKKDSKIKVAYFLDTKSGYHINYDNHKNNAIKTKIQLKL
jgi:three-Cys-motif partner protein